MRAVKLINDLQGKTFEKKTAELCLMNLQGLRIELLHTFKILSGPDTVDWSIWLNILGTIPLEPQGARDNKKI